MQGTERYAAVCATVINKLGQNSISKMTLEKLVFLIDVAHISNFSGESLTGLNYIAQEFGPVPANTDGSRLDTGQILAEYFESHPVSVNFDERHINFSMSLSDAPELSPSELDLITNIVKVYGEESPESLSQITHEFPAWFMSETNSIIDAELLKVPYRFSDPVSP